MWGYIHSVPVPFREGNLEKYHLTHSTPTQHSAQLLMQNEEWQEPDSVTGQTDSPAFQCHNNICPNLNHPVETIIEKSTLLPMYLCLCSRTDSSENSKSVGLVLKFRRKKPLQLLSYIFCSFLTYMEVNDYGISNAEEAFYGLQSPTSPKGKHLPVLRQQENNRIAKTLAEKTNSLSINFQSIPKC